MRNKSFSAAHNSHNMLLARINRSVEKPNQLQPVAEKRWAKRKPINSYGLLVLQETGQNVHCFVKDGSSAGALIDLSVDEGIAELSSHDLPDNFMLVLQRYRERSEVECVVVRRTGSLAGLRYASAFKTIIGCEAAIIDPSVDTAENETHINYSK